MASHTPNPRAKNPKPSVKQYDRTQPSNDPPEVVDPVWLVKAIGITLLAALVCGYLTVCLLFYQGQWQIVLHPSRSTPAPSTVDGTPYKTVHFSVDDTGAPQLTGWLVPAEPNDRYAAYTILYLPGGDGSLADTTPTISALHQVGINVFAFDYRGYGQSAPTRPNQRRMTEDAASAWQYLTVSRALAPSHVIPFGIGIGAALAAQLASAHPEALAVILETPRPDLIQTVLADPRTGYLPIRALFHEDFKLSAPVANLKTPKLFLLSTTSSDPSATAAGLQRLTSAAATPKIVSAFPPSDFNGSLFREQIAHFLDQYLH